MTGNIMNDQEFDRRVKVDIKRILSQTAWGNDSIPPSAFEFEARPIDIEMWLQSHISGEPHPSIVHVELACKCGAWVAHMPPFTDFQTGDFTPESIKCTSSLNTCGEFTLEYVLKMYPSTLAKYFKVRETLYGDDTSKWPNIIKDVEDKDGRYLAELPMTREELVHARVLRFHNARRSFRKDFP
jgi:hypothetical protein